MPRLTKSVPKYRKHKASGLAMVRMNGHDFYLGKYRSPESKHEYDRLVGEWVSRGRQLPPNPPDQLTVQELVNRYRKHCLKYYRKHDRQTSAIREIRNALKPVRQLYGHTPATDFGPLALKAVRRVWIEAGLVRSTINNRVHKVRNMFKWATSEEILPVSVYQALRTVKGLDKDREAGVPEPREVKGVSLEDPDVQATLEHLSPTLAALVKFQWYLACRPGEACILRRCDLDQSEDVWVYRPWEFKTEHHEGSVREIAVPPEAQKVVAELLLNREPEDYVFSPRDAQQARYQKLRTNPNKPRKRRPFANLNPHYSTCVYHNAIHRACAAAGVPIWSPNQLRHGALDAIERRHDLKTASIIAGHTNVQTTQGYLDSRNLKVAQHVMKDLWKKSG